MEGRGAGRRISATEANAEPGKRRPEGARPEFRQGVYHLFPIAGSLLIGFDAEAQGEMSGSAENPSGSTPGPDADLVPLDGGSKHAIVFHAPFRGLAPLNSGLEAVASFLEMPMAAGVAGLVSRDPATGTFVYATGQAWSVAEIVGTLAAKGEVGGVRAGLELCELTALILQEGAELGHKQGVFCHGSLSPWRVMIDAEGIPVVIGYGLPPIEVLEFLRSDENIPSVDAFRYSPPERLRGEPEDISSDVYSLALVAIEMMIGLPLYDGELDQVFEQAESGAALQRLDQLSDVLPDLVRDVLAGALEPDPNKRYRDALEFADLVKELLGAGVAEGPGLIEVLGMMNGTAAPAPAPVDPEALDALANQAVESAKEAKAAAGEARSALDEVVDELAESPSEAAVALAGDAAEGVEIAAGHAATASDAAKRASAAADLATAQQAVADADAAAQLALDAAADVLAKVEEAVRISREAVAERDRVAGEEQARALEALAAELEEKGSVWSSHAARLAAVVAELRAEEGRFQEQITALGGSAGLLAAGLAEAEGLMVAERPVWTSALEADAAIVEVEARAGKAGDLLKSALNVASEAIAAAEAARAEAAAQAQLEAAAREAAEQAAKEEAERLAAAAAAQESAEQAAKEEALRLEQEAARIAAAKAEEERLAKEAAEQAAAAEAAAKAEEERLAREAAERAAAEEAVRAAAEREAAEAAAKAEEQRLAAERAAAETAERLAKEAADRAAALAAEQAEKEALEAKLSERNLQAQGLSEHLSALVQRVEGARQRLAAGAPNASLETPSLPVVAEGPWTELSGADTGIAALQAAIGQAEPAAAAFDAQVEQAIQAARDAERALAEALQAKLRESRERAERAWKEILVHQKAVQELDSDEEFSAWVESLPGVPAGEAAEALEAVADRLSSAAIEAKERRERAEQRAALADAERAAEQARQKVQAEIDAWKARLQQENQRLEAAQGQVVAALSGLGAGLETAFVAAFREASEAMAQALGADDLSAVVAAGEAALVAIKRANEAANTAVLGAGEERQRIQAAETRAASAGARSQAAIARARAAAASVEASIRREAVEMDVSGLLSRISALEWALESVPDRAEAAERWAHAAESEASQLEAAAEALEAEGAGIEAEVQVLADRRREETAARLGALAAGRERVAAAQTVAEAALVALRKAIAAARAESEPVNAARAEAEAGLRSIQEAAAALSGEVDPAFATAQAEAAEANSRSIAETCARGVALAEAEAEARREAAQKAEADRLEAEALADWGARYAGRLEELRQSVAGAVGARDRLMAALTLHGATGDTVGHLERVQGALAGLTALPLVDGRFERSSDAEQAFAQLEEIAKEVGVAAKLVEEATLAGIAAAEQESADRLRKQEEAEEQARAEAQAQLQSGLEQLQAFDGEVSAAIDRWSSAVARYAIDGSSVSAELQGFREASTTLVKELEAEIRASGRASEELRMVAAGVAARLQRGRELANTANEREQMASASALAEAEAREVAQRLEAEARELEQKRQERLYRWRELNAEWAAVVEAWRSARAITPWSNEQMVAAEAVVRECEATETEFAELQRRGTLYAERLAAFETGEAPQAWEEPENPSEGDLESAAVVLKRGRASLEEIRSERKNLDSEAVALSALAEAVIDGARLEAAARAEKVRQEELARQEAERLAQEIERARAGATRARTASEAAQGARARLESTLASLEAVGAGAQQARERASEAVDLASESADLAELEAAGPFADSAAAAKSAEHAESCAMEAEKAAAVAASAEVDGVAAAEKEAREREEAARRSEQEQQEAQARAEEARREAEALAAGRQRAENAHRIAKEVLDRAKGTAAETKKQARPLSEEMGGVLDALEESVRGVIEHVEAADRARKQARSAKLSVEAAQGADAAQNAAEAAESASQAVQQAAAVVLAQVERVLADREAQRVQAISSEIAEHVAAMAAVQSNVSAKFQAMEAAIEEASRVLPLQGALLRQWEQSGKARKIVDSGEVDPALDLDGQRSQANKLRKQVESAATELLAGLASFESSLREAVVRKEEEIREAEAASASAWAALQAEIARGVEEFAQLHQGIVGDTTAALADADGWEGSGLPALRKQLADRITESGALTVEVSATDLESGKVARAALAQAIEKRAAVVRQTAVTIDQVRRALEQERAAFSSLDAEGVARVGQVSEWVAAAQGGLAEFEALCSENAVSGAQVTDVRQGWKQGIERLEEAVSTLQEALESLRQCPTSDGARAISVRMSDLLDRAQRHRKDLVSLVEKGKKAVTNEVAERAERERREAEEREASLRALEELRSKGEQLRDQLRTLQEELQARVNQAATAIAETGFDVPLAAMVLEPSENLEATAGRCAGALARVASMEEATEVARHLEVARREFEASTGWAEDVREAVARAEAEAEALWEAAERTRIENERKAKEEAERLAAAQQRAAEAVSKAGLLSADLDGIAGEIEARRRSAVERALVSAQVEQALTSVDSALLLARAPLGDVYTAQTKAASAAVSSVADAAAEAAWQSIRIVEDHRDAFPDRLAAVDASVAASEAEWHGAVRQSSAKMEAWHSRIQLIFNKVDASLESTRGFVEVEAAHQELAQRRAKLEERLQLAERIVADAVSASRRDAALAILEPLAGLDFEAPLSALTDAEQGLDEAWAAAQAKNAELQQASAEIAGEARAVSQRAWALVEQAEARPNGADVALEQLERVKQAGWDAWNAGDRAEAAVAENAVRTSDFEAIRSRVMQARTEAEAALERATVELSAFHAAVDAAEAEIARQAALAAAVGEALSAAEPLRREVSEGLGRIRSANSDLDARLEAHPGAEAAAPARARLRDLLQQLSSIDTSVSGAIDGISQALAPDVAGMGLGAVQAAHAQMVEVLSGMEALVAEATLLADREAERLAEVERLAALARAEQTLRDGVSAALVTVSGHLMELQAQLEHSEPEHASTASTLLGHVGRGAAEPAWNAAVHSRHAAQDVAGMLAKVSSELQELPIEQRAQADLTGELNRLEALVSSVAQSAALAQGSLREWRLQVEQALNAADQEAARLAEEERQRVERAAAERLEAAGAAAQVSWNHWISVWDPVKTECLASLDRDAVDAGNLAAELEDHPGRAYADEAVERAARLSAEASGTWTALQALHQEIQGAWPSEPDLGRWEAFSARVPEQIEQLTPLERTFQQAISRAASARTEARALAAGEAERVAQEKAAQLAREQAEREAQLAREAAERAEREAAERAAQEAAEAEARALREAAEAEAQALREAAEAEAREAQAALEAREREARELAEAEARAAKEAAEAQQRAVAAQQQAAEQELARLQSAAETAAQQAKDAAAHAGDAVRGGVALTTGRAEPAIRELYSKLEAAGGKAASAAREAVSAVRLGEDDATPVEAAETLASAQAAAERARGALTEAQAIFEQLRELIRPGTPIGAVPRDASAPARDVGASPRDASDRISRLRRGREERREGESLPDFYARVRAARDEAAADSPAEPTVPRQPRFAQERPANTELRRTLNSEAADPAAPAVPEGERPRSMSREDRLARLRRGRPEGEGTAATPRPVEERRRLSRDADPEVAARIERLRALRGGDAAEGEAPRPRTAFRREEPATTADVPRPRPPFGERPPRPPLGETPARPPIGEGAPRPRRIEDLRRNRPPSEDEEK